MIFYKHINNTYSSYIFYLIQFMILKNKVIGIQNC